LLVSHRNAPIPGSPAAVPDGCGRSSFLLLYALNCSTLWTAVRLELLWWTAVRLVPARAPAPTGKHPAAADAPSTAVADRTGRSFCRQCHGHTHGL